MAATDLREASSKFESATLPGQACFSGSSQSQGTLLPMSSRSILMYDWYKLLFKDQKRMMGNTEWNGASFFSIHRRHWEKTSPFLRFSGSKARRLGFGSVWVTWVTWPKFCGNYAVVSQKSKIFWFHYPVADRFPDLRPIFADAQVKVHEILRSLSFTRCNLSFFMFLHFFLYISIYDIFCILAMSLGSPSLFCSTSKLFRIGPSPSAQVFLLLTAITIPWGLWSGDPSHPSHPSQGPLGPLG